VAVAARPLTDTSTSTQRSPAAVRDALDRGLKRGLDLVASAALLLLFAAPIALIALAIKLDSRGPVFYRGRRVGYRGRPLAMLKFRKMRDDAVGLPLTAADDDRFTRVGRFLTRTKLDELPQLWNVLKGEMSLVGPRPEDPKFVALREDDYREILGVRPGVTGLTQLVYIDESSMVDPADPVRDYVERLLPEKTALDRLYASSRTLAMDLQILGWTAVAVVFGRQVAVDPATGRIARIRRPEVASAVLDGQPPL
jgi:lipopolysaccharide/colanic/teichoic acid biosynthesis glycosyltransferase